MGHPKENAMIKTQRITNDTPTVVSRLGKQTVKPFPSRSERKASRALELVHTGVMGPIKTVFKGGSRYVLKFVDAFSKFVVYFLKCRREVVAKLAEFRVFYEIRFGERLKCLRPDNGTGFVNKKMATLPQQNGVVESMNRTIMEKARSMLYYKGVSTMWWGRSLYLINRSSNSTHSNVTPYEVCFKVKPRLEHLRVFGSLGYGHIDDVKRTKIESKSFKCMFLICQECERLSRASKPKISRSVKLDERELEGIYDTPSSQHHGTVIHVTKDGDEGTVLVDEERQSVADEPIKAAAKPILDVEMDDVEPEMNVKEVMRLSPPESSGSTGLITSTVPFTARSVPGRSTSISSRSGTVRRSREPVFRLDNGQNDREVSRSEGSDGPPSPKRAESMRMDSSLGL
ncbi:Rve domain containing hypothetical protein [Phytophthora palmivora]|uniref:Integrase catalytic domain-containing protein n=1 Tax=Phytophthora palmivora TaxID=4796 RepID=A0A2P4YC49_9STRA|nr:Rve domain containing hypothetical protein [Phytophthora palmivora]